MKKFKILYFTLFVALCLGAESLLAETQEIKMSTFDGKKFIFPADIKGSPLSLLFLAVADNRNDGELQQKILIEWHLALESSDMFTEHLSSYHFSVVSKAPFFVRKLIASKIADVYKGIVSPGKSGAIFVKDLNFFTSDPRFSLNGKPSLVLLSLENKLILKLSGSPDKNKIDFLQAEIDAYIEKKKELGNVL